MLGSAPRGLRILLVAMSRTLHSEVDAALQAVGGGHVLYWVSQADLAGERAEDLSPDVILVDEGFADAPALIGVLTERMPDSMVLYMAQPGASDAISEAMLAGARTFLAKPVRRENLGRLLTQLQAVARPTPTLDERRDQGRVVVFCSPKGGTGRTSLATNTAIGLMQLGEESVVLVDADYAAPAIDVVLNVMPERTILDLLPRLAQMDDSLMQGVLSRHASGVRLLLAPEPAGLVEKPITGAEVQQVVALLRRLFRWTIVDLGLPMDELAFAFADSADLVALSVLPEMVGLRNMRLLLAQLAERHYDHDNIWVVLNRANMAGGISKGDIEKHLRASVRIEIPDDQALATNAVNRGIPVLAAHSRGALPKAYRSFVLALKSALQETGDGEGKPSRERARRPAR